MPPKVVHLLKSTQSAGGTTQSKGALFGRRRKNQFLSWIVPFLKVFVSSSGRISIVFEAEVAASAHEATVTAEVDVATGKVLTRTYRVELKLPLERYARNPPELLKVSKTFCRVCLINKVDVLSPLMVAEP
jgi:hypothetical protein